MATNQFGMSSLNKVDTVSTKQIKYKQFFQVDSRTDTTINKACIGINSSDNNNISVSVGTMSDISTDRWYDPDPSLATSWKKSGWVLYLYGSDSAARTAEGLKNQNKLYIQYTAAPDELTKLSNLDSSAKKYIDKILNWDYSKGAAGSGAQTVHAGNSTSSDAMTVEIRIAKNATNVITSGNYEQLTIGSVGNVGTRTVTTGGTSDSKTVACNFTTNTTVDYKYANNATGVANNGSTAETYYIFIKDVQSVGEDTTLNVIGSLGCKVILGIKLDKYAVVFEHNSKDNITLQPNTGTDFNIVCDKLTTNSGGVTASDRRIKTDIIKFDSDKAYNLIKDLNVVKYKNLINGDHAIGIIAQEVKELLPCCVVTKPFVKEGIIEVTDFNFVKYDHLYNIHMKCSQRLIELVEQQRIELDELKAKVAALENK